MRTGIVVDGRISPTTARPEGALMKIQWLTDLHLDKADEMIRCSFLRSLRAAAFDMAIVTGDISDSRSVTNHIACLAESIAPRPVYYTLGNHDYYGGKIGDVEGRLDALCSSVVNLHRLGRGYAVALGDSIGLLGHDGWGDGRARGARPRDAYSPDRRAIDDFRELSMDAWGKVNRELGDRSVSYFRRVLPYALTCYRNVLIATHVPPFANAVKFGNRTTSPTALSCFVNAGAGALIKKIAGQFPDRNIEVLCGHTHCRAEVRIAPNIRVRVGHAKIGRPQRQRLIRLN